MLCHRARKSDLLVSHQNNAWWPIHGVCTFKGVCGKALEWSTKTWEWYQQKISSDHRTTTAILHSIKISVNEDRLRLLFTARSMRDCFDNLSSRSQTYTINVSQLGFCVSRGISCIPVLDPLHRYPISPLRRWTIIPLHNLPIYNIMLLCFKTFFATIQAHNCTYTLLNHLHYCAWQPLHHYIIIFLHYYPIYTIHLVSPLHIAPLLHLN